MNYSNNLVVLLKLLKGYSSDIESIITDDSDKEFDDGGVSGLIESLMDDLKDLNRNM
jgi:hypothetical protein